MTDPPEPTSVARVARTMALAVALLVAARPAFAQPASTHETAATAAYEAGDLATALREFEAAYVETRRPDLLYVIGRLYAEGKDCGRANDHFIRFLATGPGPNASEGANAEIAKCQQVLDSQRAAGGGSDRGASPIGTPPSPPPDPVAVAAVDGRRFFKDKLGLALLGGGVAAEVVAVLIYTQARSAQCGDPVCSNLTYDAYQAAEDQARSRRLTSVIVAGVGGALLAGGVVRYLTRDDRDRETSLSVRPTGGGAEVVLGGRF